MTLNLLRQLLILNALGCIVAGIMLIVFPYAIPSLIGIGVEPSQYMIGRLLGASELAIAAACVIAIRRPSQDSRDTCLAVLVVFHVGSIAAGATELVDRFDAIVLTNIAVRAADVMLLLLLGRHRPTAW